MAELLFITANDVEQLFDVRTAVASQRHAFLALDEGAAHLAPRLLLPNEDDGSVAFCYLARLSGDSGLVYKVGSVNPQNGQWGLPGVSALVIALDPVTGQPCAVLEGTAITAFRTAAASALAAQYLADSGPAHLTVFGCGVQGQAHVRTFAHVLDLEGVEICGRRVEETKAVAEKLSTELDLPVAPGRDPESAVRRATIVATCTTSSVPVFSSSWLTPGCTVLSVGSFAPDRSETDGGLIELADLIVVDDVATACEQAGPIVDAIARGTLTPDDLIALGSVISGRSPLHRRPSDIVFYNSTGIGVQDAAAAWSIIAAARTRGVGLERECGSLGMHETSRSSQRPSAGTLDERQSVAARNSRTPEEQHE